jgi:hypothetical protein
MTIRHKTVAFATGVLPTLADAVLTALPTTTAQIPEIGAAGTAILECWVELSCWDTITATGGTVTEHRIALSVNGATATSITETDDFANSAENMAFVVGPIEFSAHAIANWTVNTPVDLVVSTYWDHTTGTTLGMRNVSAIVYVTYAYDDNPAVNPTQLKTVPVPLDSRTAALPTASADYGDGIPALTATIMPESGASAVDWFMVIEGNEATTTTADWTLNCTIDGGSASTFQPQESGLNSGRYGRWVYKPSVPDITSAHSFEMWSAATARLNHGTVTVFCTYTFNAAATTRIGNSLLIPIEMSSPLGVTTASEASRFQRTISIQEPAPTLQQSAFRINFNVGAPVAGLRWRAGSQAFRIYTHAASLVCGMFSLQQRIDSGGAQGAGFSLARGLNTITVDGYSTDVTDQVTNINGYILLNYTSDVPADGIGAAAHTVHRHLWDFNAQLVDRVRTNNVTFPIPEPDYWLMASGFMLRVHNVNAGNALTFDVECLVGEAKGGGYYDIYADLMQSDGERGFTETWMRGRDVFKRYPEDPDPERLDPEIARDYRLMTSGTVGSGGLMIFTYHSQTWTIAGNISGHDPLLPTDIRLIHADTGEIRGVVTLSAGVTAFSFTVHDNTESYYVSAYQNDTSVGRSGTGTAV